MAGVVGVLMMACAGLFAAACAINFFWQIGYKRAFAYAGGAIAAFLLFWSSGIWEGASRHSWGVLAPTFALLIIGIWLGAKYLPILVKFAYKKIKEKNQKD